VSNRDITFVWIEIDIWVTEKMVLEEGTGRGLAGGIEEVQDVGTACNGVLVCVKM
jgi:hypothetical protein